MARDYDDDDYRDEEDDPPTRSKVKSKTKPAPERRRDDDDDDEERPARRRSRRDDDDEEDEPPRRSRSRREEEDDDEPPRRPRSRSRDDDADDAEPPRRRASRKRDDDDDADEDDPPRRSRSRDDDDDEPPRSRSRRRDEDDEEEEKPRRARGRSRDRDDDDADDEPRSRRDRGRSSREEEEEAPRSASRSKRTAKRHLPTGGWSEAQRVSDSTAGFAKSLSMKPGDPNLIIKFLDAQPYVNFRRHWVDEAKGKKSFVCLEGIDPKGCPLCDMGHRATGMYCFNVLQLAEGEDPVLRSFDVGPQLKDQFFNYNNDQAVGPLTKHYFVVKKPAGKGSRMSVSPVKGRDLEEDYGIEPLTKEDMEEFGAEKHDKSIVEMPSYRQLDELRSMLEGDD